MFYVIFVFYLIYMVVCGLTYEPTVEERSSPEGEDVGDVRVGFLTAGVEDHIPLDAGHHQVPLPVGHVVGEVRHVGGVDEVDLVPIVGPAGELHGAGLLVEGEIFHVDLTGRLEDRRAEPGHVPVRGDDGVGAGQPRAVLLVRVVVEDDVRLPDDLGRHPDDRDGGVLRPVPLQHQLSPLTLLTLCLTIYSPIMNSFLYKSLSHVLTLQHENKIF